MIYTITCNPSLDYIMHVSSFNEGKTNRSTHEEIYPGGKGFNISIVLNRLGHDNKALGFVAGFTGDHIEKLIHERGISSEFIHLDEGVSRINVKMNGEVETEINGNGPNIPESKLQELYQHLDNMQTGDILILAGSVPSSLPTDIYKRIMIHLRPKKIRIIVDASNDLLLQVLRERPFLIKPNHQEIEEIFHVSIDTQADLIYYAQSLQQMGAQNVLVSDGGNGALLISHDRHVYLSNAAKGKVISTIGSGDSMIAGFIAGYLENQDYKEALRLGSACGGATAFSHDLATKDYIDEIYSQITVKQLR